MHNEFIHDVGGKDDEVEEMDGVSKDLVTLSNGCVISTDGTTTIDEQMHVQEEIIMDSGGIELSQGEDSAVSNEEATILDLSAISYHIK